MQLMRRLGRIVLAYIAASVSAAAIFLLLFWAPDFDWDTLYRGPPAFLAFAIGMVAILGSPAFFVVVFAEFAGIRNWIFYAGAGFLIVAGSLFLGVANGFASSAGKVTLFLVYLQALFGGVVAGTTYWAIAGRSAGRPRRRREAQ